MAARCSDGIWSKRSMARARARGQTAQSKEPIGDQEPITSLRSEVKQALLMVLRDPAASAAAKASAGRTLLEYFESDNSSATKRRGAEMSAAELDAAIAELD
jgi:hypothetical protein